MIIKLSPADIAAILSGSILDRVNSGVIVTIVANDEVLYGHYSLWQRDDTLEGEQPIEPEVS